MVLLINFSNKIILPFSAFKNCSFFYGTDDDSDATYDALLWYSFLW